ncbi:MAG: TrkA family potassium uptake protein [Deltaproteobacteria bacterium]|nr:TrkA family potassium uptake protein [Deltaproteobacteria bacterium]
MQIAIIGVGRFGTKLATTVARLGAEVIAVDTREHNVEEVKDRVAQAVVADCTDERAMRAIGISDVDVAVVAIGEDLEMSVMSTVVLRRLGVSKIVARAVSQIHEQILKEMGASQIIRIEEQMGEQVAHWLVAPDVLQRISFPGGYTLVEMRVPEKFMGKTLVESRVREDYGLTVAAIQKRIPEINEEGKSHYRIKTMTPPNPTDQMGEDDILVVIGEDEKIDQFLRED